MHVYPITRTALCIAIAIAIASVAACGSDTSSTGSTERSSTTGASSSTASGDRASSNAQKNGVATFYDADGSGNCSFDASPNDLDVAAMDKSEYDNSNSCGACLAVTGPKGNVTVRVVDSCPGCSDNGVNLDLSASAFAKIANPDDGRINITYQLVACNVTGNIEYHFKDGSSKYWTAIQIRNHKVPIAKVEYDKGGGSYVAMDRADYNYFIASSGVGDQPNGLKLRTTASDGQVIDDTVTGGINPDTTVTGAKQFQ